MNRFIKKNIFLVGTLAISALIVLFLLVFAVMQYFEMNESIEKTNELRDRNSMLMRQQPPAVPENIKLIEKNIDGYSKAESQLKIYFGQPLYPALETFCKDLKITAEDLRKEFKKFYEEKGFNIDSNRQQVCRDFRDSQISAHKTITREKWDDAMDKFIKEAEKTTVEKISDHNYEEIFLSCLGLPRNMGGSDDSMRVFRTDMQKRIVKIFETNGKDIDILGINFLAKRPVEAIKDNKAFNDKKDRIASNKNTTSSAAENTSYSSEATQGMNKADEIRHWEIICDLTKRLCEAKEKVSSIEEVSYSDLAGKNVNSCNYYTYTLVVTGSEKSVRELLNSMSAAYEKHRIYVVRNLSIIKQEDQVQDIIDLANKRIGTSAVEEKSSLSTTASSNNKPEFGASSDDEKKQVVSEEYFKETGNYKDRVAGRSNIVTAAVTFDYIVYNINVTK